MFVTSDSWPVPRKTDEFNFVGIVGLVGNKLGFKGGLR